ncbi:MAG: LOG family protein, partial [Actinobacteria bacterium]|nr:LOG family protein [Actinomycetota bacterium]
GGPGIMTAGIEGAGRDNSFGVTIRLPFEPMDGGGIVPMERLVRFRNFFSRKLTFMRQSQAYVVFPGGFGTMDEVFELLVLIQTGKSTPAPVVLFEPDGDNYWGRFMEFLDLELLQAGLIAANDLNLVFVTSSTEDALDYINEFYRGYHSMRWVGDQLVIRMNHEVSDGRLAELNAEFSDLVVSGSITRTEPLPAELDDDDVVQLPRLVLTFDQRSYARLQQFVRALATN